MTTDFLQMWGELAAQTYEPQPRRWARPGDLARALDPQTHSSPALDMIDDELVALADHTSGAEALAIFIPPGEGKSQRASRRFPEWLLADNPALRIAIVSYEQEMATRWGRQILRDLRHADPGAINVRVMRDSAAAGRWDTPEGGGIYCAGIGGALTGRPVDCLRGDTPIVTQTGYITVRDIHRAARKPPVLSYNHATGQTEWKPVIASRAIPGRRLVEVFTTAGRRLTCTPDHLVATARDYVRAQALVPGDRLTVLPVRAAVSTGGIRARQAGAGRADPVLLLAGLCGGGPARRRAPLPEMRQADRVETSQAAVLLHRMPRSSQTGQAKETVPAMHGAVHPQEQPDHLLHAGLREPGPLNPDGRGRQLAFQGRDQLHRMVPANAPADPSTGQGVPGLPATRTDRSPHQPRPTRQPAGESNPGLPDLSHGAPQVEADTVAMVRELRGVRDTVYDLQVADNRNFFAGQVLVHNCLIIDDPVKDREAAESATYRERAWDWWESVALTRLAPGGVVCLIQTRWHESDLSGQILSKPSPLRWRVLSIPAIAEDHDPLGRQPGEELQSVREREPGHFAKIRAGTSAYVFAGLYQQSPTAAEGNFFRRAAFRYWQPASGIGDPAVPLARGSMAGVWIELEGRRVDLADPAVWRFATVDVAASTRTTADYTVCSVWAISHEGDLILLDRSRGRAEMSDHFAMVKPLRERWHFDVCYVEHQFYSKTLVTDAREAGIPVAEVQADTDKVTRAIPAAGRVHAGKVWFPAGAAWLEEWENELASFPAGAHDDQVDTLSYAARIAAAHWTPAPPPQRPRRTAPELEQIQQAFDAATGNGFATGDHDLMHMPLG